MKGMAMKLLELTDFFSKTKKEYVVVEKIVRFQPYTEKFMRIKSDEREVLSEPGILGRFFGQKPTLRTEKFEVSREEVDRDGTSVRLSDDEETIVLETPEQVAKLLADGNFIEVKGV